MAAMSIPAVETVDVTKTFGKTEALRGLSLRVEQGEIFALLGPNGAGKTTWISIVCGLARPTSGTASVLGRDVVRESMAVRHLVGLVPQELNIDPFFTCRRVLYYQMGYFGLRPDHRRVDEVLEALGLADRADFQTTKLSGGMRRRLLVAKALIHRPRVAFLDEPTAGVDIALRHDLWEYLRKLREQGMTIVLTTHYLEEAETLADRVGVIAKGQLLTHDTPKQLIGRHGRKRVRFILRDPVVAAALPAMLRDSGATVDQEGKRLSITINATEFSSLLGTIAALPGTAVTDIEMEQPSLEQVFLTLTVTGR